jgi:hypothetical protein
LRIPCAEFALPLHIPCAEFALPLRIPCAEFALPLRIPCAEFALALWSYTPSAQNAFPVQSFALTVRSLPSPCGGVSIIYSTKQTRDKKRWHEIGNKENFFRIFPGGSYFFGFTGRESCLGLETMKSSSMQYVLPSRQNPQCLHVSGLRDSNAG